MDKCLLSSVTFLYIFHHKSDHTSSSEYKYNCNRDIGNSNIAARTDGSISKNIKKNTGRKYNEKIIFQRPR